MRAGVRGRKIPEAVRQGGREGLGGGGGWRGVRRLCLDPLFLPTGGDGREGNRREGWRGNKFTYRDSKEGWGEREGWRDGGMEEWREGGREPGMCTTGGCSTRSTNSNSKGTGQDTARTVVAIN